MNTELIEGIDYFVNENGLLVFTAAYLLRRGYCCGNGCLFCPYHFEAVPEQAKTILLKARKKREGGDLRIKN